MSLNDATALICGRSLERFSEILCFPLIISLRFVCSVRLFSIPICRHSSSVNTCCAPRGKSEQARAKLSNSLFISFFLFIRRKVRALHSIYRYEIFAFTVHIFLFLLRSVIISNKPMLRKVFFISLKTYNSLVFYPLKIIFALYY